MTSILPLVQDCSGEWLIYQLGGCSFYDAPILNEWGAPFAPTPTDPPKQICLGTKIRLELSHYCHEAYLDAGSRFTLYKRCPPNLNIWTEINSGDPLDSLLDSGCEIWAEATSPGADEISLTGEDSWARRKDVRVPLRYEVVPRCPDCGGGPETDWIDMSFLVNRRCYPNETWDNPIILATDDCGNEFSVTCTNGEYVTSINGGTCIWTCGQNWWKFKRTSGPCGTRISGTFHRTMDLVSTCDRGTCGGVYDYQDTFTSCDGSITPPRCCALPYNPYGNQNADCPVPGICDDESECGDCSCP